MPSYNLTQQELRDLLDYDPETGIFRWKVNKNSQAMAGDIAGGITRSRYRQIAIYGRKYYAHRLAWFYVYGSWPSEVVDHIDGDSRNNAISNLRECSQRQNTQNRRPNKTNPLGLLGVTFDKSRGMYKAAIGHNGRRLNVGRYNTALEASEAYWKAKKELHEFCPNNRE
jgi:hypothetical protein